MKHWSHLKALIILPSLYLIKDSLHTESHLGRHPESSVGQAKTVKLQTNIVLSLRSIFSVSSSIELTSTQNSWTTRKDDQ